MASTNVPPLAWSASGWNAPLDDDILAGVQADLQTAFGGKLNFTTSTGSVTNPTPQGQLAESLTAVISSANDIVLFITSMIDPAFSRGRWHSAIGRIYYQAKNASSASVVQVTCIGGGQAPIPAGAQIVDVNGNYWQSLTGATIDNSGSVVVQFSCMVDGPIACPAGALNSANGAQIVSAVSGWDSIQNVSDATLGTNEETDQAFEQRRSLSTAVNGTCFTDAMRGAVLAVPNVFDAYVVENASAEAVTIMGYTLLPYSVLISVVGGAQADIGTAIWSKHNPGCIYNGNTSFVVYDTSQGYSAPYPSYQMTWETPAPLPILVQVSIKNYTTGATVPSNADALIQQAVVLAFSGQDPQGFDQSGNSVTGQKISWPSLFAERFKRAVDSLWPGEQLVDVLIGSPNSPASTFSGAINGTTLTVSGAVTGAIAIGQNVMDLTGRVLPGTAIVGGSGTTWQVSKTQVVTSEIMYGVVAAEREIDFTLSQTPSIAAQNVSVVIVS